MTTQIKKGFLSGTVTGSSLADCSDIALRVAQQYFGADAEVIVMLTVNPRRKYKIRTDPSFRVSFKAMLKGV